MKNLGRKLLALFVVMSMIFTMVPSAFAEDSTASVSLSDCTKIGEIVGSHDLYYTTVPAGTKKVQFSDYEADNLVMLSGSSFTESGSVWSVPDTNTVSFVDNCKITNQDVQNNLSDDGIVLNSEGKALNFDGCYDYFLISDDDYAEVIIKVEEGSVPEETADPQGNLSFTVSANGTEYGIIESVKKGYSYTDYSGVTSKVNLHTIAIPKGTEKVDLEFSEKVLAYNYKNNPASDNNSSDFIGESLPGTEYFVGRTEYTLKTDNNDDKKLDYIQVQTPYDSSYQTTVLCAIQFVEYDGMYIKELNKIKSENESFHFYSSSSEGADYDYSMLGNNWTKSNPLMAEAKETKDTLYDTNTNNFRYLAADTTVPAGIENKDVTATWYYSDNYSASGKGYKKATCKGENYSTNDSGSLVSSGVASDNENVEFQNSKCSYGSDYFDFRVYPDTSMCGTYYYYVDLTYKDGDDIVTLSSKSSQATVTINHKKGVLKAVAPKVGYPGKTAGEKCIVCGKVLKAQKTVAVKNPSATKIIKVTGVKKAFAVKWKKSSSANATGYQVQYSTSSKFKSPKTVKVKGYKYTSKTIKKLKRNKKYYVRVRCYKTVSGKNYYSSWSKVKAVKTR